MTTTTHTREAITKAIEQSGIVAVIRIKEPQRLQAIVDAISQGGIRAMEVTMTVPGAIAFTFTPREAHSFASPLVSCASAPFAAV